MNKKVFRIIKYALFFGVGVCLFFVFSPRTYNVPPLKERENTKYWNLTTGSKIGYTLVPTRGEKKPYPVIFLQGGPGGFISNRNIEMLAPLSEIGYDIYLYDQIGSGHSDRLENIEEYTADRHKRDLEEIIKKTGAEKVILIGQSWGAVLATLYIADNPDKVEKLIVTGPGPIQPVRKELANIKAPDSLNITEPVYSNREANDAAYNFRSTCTLKCALMFGYKLASDKEADDFLTYLNDKLNKSTVCDTTRALKAEGGGGFYAHVMTVQSLTLLQDPRPKLKHSNIPILVMKGQCDNQKWGFTSEYLDLFTNHQLAIIPGAGHSISIEQPALYLKTISDFLDK